jgi:hypothetical protein
MLDRALAVAARRILARAGDGASHSRRTSRAQRRWSPSATDIPHAPTWPAYPRSETT